MFNNARKPSRPGAKLRLDVSTMIKLYFFGTIWYYRFYILTPFAMMLVANRILDLTPWPFHISFFHAVVATIGSILALDAERISWWLRFRANEKRWNRQKQFCRSWMMACAREGVRGQDPWLIGTPYPEPKNIKDGYGGNYSFEGKFPKGLILPTLRQAAPRLGGQLGAKSVTFKKHPTERLDMYLAEVVFSDLPTPIVHGDGTVETPLHLKVTPMGKDRGAKVAMGNFGWEKWHPAILPHATVLGPTGVGKTITARNIALQWECTPLHKLYVIDPQATADTAAMHFLPDCTLFTYDPNDMVNKLELILGHLQSELRYIGKVNKVVTEEGVTKWSELPDDAKKRYPSHLNYYSELSFGLGKTDDEEEGELKKAIGKAWSDIILTGRKGGVHTLSDDQMTLSGDTYLGRSAATSVEYRIIVGGVAARHHEAAFGGYDPPEIAEVKGRCLVGQYGRDNFKVGQVPFISHPDFFAYCERRAGRQLPGRPKVLKLAKAG